MCDENGNLVDVVLNVAWPGGEQNIVASDKGLETCGDWMMLDDWDVQVNEDKTLDQGSWD